MPRTLINLDPEDKEWLDEQARSRHVAMTELVREAVHEYRIRQQSRAQPSLQAAVERTAGLGRAGDGLAYQQRMREEWDETSCDSCSIYA